MSVDMLPYLPAHIRAVVEQLAASMKLDPNTVVAAVLAHGEIKKLPIAKQREAIAVIVALHEIGKMIDSE